MGNWIEQRRILQPNQRALTFQNQTWTFQEAFEEIKEWQGKLIDVIPEEQKRVAILSQNSADFYWLILALWQLDKEIVFLNTHLVSSELNFQLRDSKTEIVLVADNFQDKVIEIENRYLFSEIQQRDIQPIGQRDCFSLDKVASIMYTSGTTGQPKGVLQTFGNHYGSAIATQKNLEITVEDTWACAVPLFHISGLSILIRSFVLGCGVYLLPSFSSAQLTTAFVAGEATVVSVVNTMLQQLLVDFPKQGYHSNFRTILLGGGPIAPTTLEACFEKNLNVIQSYGMTETCSQVVALQAENAWAKIGSSGRPLAGVHLKIQKDEIDLAANLVGEILVKGPSICPGYLNRPELRATKWTDDGYFKTGDLGYLDADGFLFVVSRLSELIISGGENIYPGEVEHCLETMPSVLEVAVIGEPDSKWGSVPVAYLVTSEPVALQAVQEFCQPYLAKYKIPREIYVVEKLPRTASGKIAKHLLLKK